MTSIPNRCAGFSPFQLIYGWNVRSPLDVVVEELKGRCFCASVLFRWLAVTCVSDGRSKDGLGYTSK